VSTKTADTANLKPMTRRTAGDRIVADDHLLDESTGDAPQADRGADRPSGACPDPGTGPSPRRRLPPASVEARVVGMRLEHRDRPSRIVWQLEGARITPLRGRSCVCRALVRQASPGRLPPASSPFGDNVSGGRSRTST